MKITNYRKAWIYFKKTPEYKLISRELKRNGIKQPYRDNMLSIAFEYGWKASGAKIEFIKL
jgi:hypothetical protein